MVFIHKKGIQSLLERFSAFYSYIDTMPAFDKSMSPVRIEFAWIDLYDDVRDICNDITKYLESEKSILLILSPERILAAIEKTGKASEFTVQQLLEMRQARNTMETLFKNLATGNVELWNSINQFRQLKNKNSEDNLLKNINSMKTILTAIQNQSPEFIRLTNKLITELEPIHTELNVSMDAFTWVRDNYSSWS